MISNNTTSEPLETNLEVLGVPLLFRLYINHLKDLSINPGIFRRLYADDLHIYLMVPVDQFHDGLAIITLAATQIFSVGWD